LLKIVMLETKTGYILLDLYILRGDDISYKV